MASSPDAEVEVLRPRIADHERYHAESEQWRNWHDEQTSQARKLMNWEAYGTTDPS
ncbi:MAG: hypothetical protein WKF37_11050 [Bryobacteraceae bacterium]